MADPTFNPPLWEVMHCAWSPHRFPGGWRLGYAAELRAIAGELESRRGFLVDGHNLGPESKAIAAWLYAEADRAEAGE
jgi:hypothetical protein